MPRTPTLAALAALAFAVTACQSLENDPPPDSDRDSGTPSETPDAAPPGDDAGPRIAPLPSAKAKQVAAGVQHTCALTTEGAVRCWGGSDKGQLGNGAPYESGSTPVPVQVTGLTAGVKMIDVGSEFSCAVTAAGGVKCWGLDDLGQLGTGIAYTDTRVQASNVPVDVKGIASGALAVSVGGSSACAILSGGTVKCWGEDEYGKLGNDSPHSPGDGSPGFLPPVDVVGLTGAVQISVGGHQACAVLETGGLVCWGSNVRGGLGIGTEDPSKRVPVAVSALGTEVVAVETGADETCAILKSGTLKCWGQGDDGLLGDGMTGTIRAVRLPQDVLGAPTGASSISLNGFACAVLSGATKCWGKGAALGTDDAPGFETYAPARAAIGLGSASQQVSVGSQHACVVTTAGAIQCWGANGEGELGNGKPGNGGTARDDQPTAVISFP
ncbi:MAG TPA: hypothetical protein VLT33_25615 [Labilithrix sp.]|nr:hypothetical protein [Labilithrix sp.]